MGEFEGLKADAGSVWVQPDGPNTKPQYLPCHNVGDVARPKGSKTLDFCPDPARSGHFSKSGSFRGEPGAVTVQVDAKMKQTQDFLEALSEKGCPFPMHIHKDVCGRRDVFTNHGRTFALSNTDIETDTYTGLFSRTPADNAFGMIQNSLEADELYISFETEIISQENTETSAFNDIASYNVEQCAGPCGAAQEKCEDMVAVSDVTAGSPTIEADVWYTNDGGGTWQMAAVEPFAGGEDLISVVAFQVGKTTWRWLVAREAAAGAMEVAYSDDEGATWTLVEVGAVAALGANYGGALFALNMYYIWLVLDSGYIYFSSDGGATWAAQTEGDVTGNDLNAVWFSDTENGMTVGDGDTVLTTTTGGSTWEDGTATGGGNDLYCVTENAGGDIWWTGDNAGGLYWSNDLGVTWPTTVMNPNPRTFSGSGTGEVKDIQFVTPLHGWMIHDTVAPLGRLFKTVNGGYDWEKETDVTNTGLNALWACGINLCFVVGEPQDATGFIGKASN